MNPTQLAAAKSASQPWHYTAREGHWDEAFRTSGFPRRHWRRLAVALRQMGFVQLGRRWRIGQQLIEANGITYNVYGDPQGKERPWQMDPIPLVIDSAEWDSVERALAQRATLLNAILADLYGPQRLLHDRRLPASVVFASPQFLRPCHGLQPPGGVFLHHYAADLARSPDGEWWVISDRTQAPSGIGYALENRLVGARTLPSVFSQCQVRPLAHFFERMLQACMALAPQNRGNPRMVLLTPGPHNETYFEHSFLARQWGIPLVEGADLAVRDSRVYLKTLAGLDQVDVIFRRLDDSFCDPLELRGESLLAVPGLLQAVRAGHVAVANSLGSGLVETAAHKAFLPGLCRHLLGEELRMPSVATWWCGDDAPRRFVLDHLEELVIKPCYPGYGKHPEFPAQMDAAARAALARRIEATPEQFVAQEQVALSTVPIRTDAGLEARHVVLRVFASWDGSAYTVMPGGLTRVSTGEQSLVVSMQQGGGSKDTWVLGSHRVDAEEFRPSALVIEGPRSSSELPSRVADNLFWLGRYVERLESGARLVRALLPGLSGEADFGRGASLDTVLHLLGGLGYLPEDFHDSPMGQKLWNLQQLLGMIVYDSARSYDIGWNLRQIRRVTWQIKERFSHDTWRVLQQLETECSGAAPVGGEQRFVAALNLLDRAIITLSAFAGLVMENITHGPGWHFLDIGRRLERALQMIDLLRVGVVQAPFPIDPYLEILLQIADSSITYRTRYLTAMRTEFLLALLLADEANPRSVGFQLSTLVDRVAFLHPSDPAGQRASVKGSFAAAGLTSIREANLDDLATRDADGDLHALDALLFGLRANLYDFSDAVTARYFTHLAPSRLARPS